MRTTETVVSVVGAKLTERWHSTKKWLTLFSTSSGKQWVVIDEVQKLPALLDMVHLEIEVHSRSRIGVTNERPCERELLFALTGSSARKLKRGNAREGVVELVL